VSIECPNCALAPAQAVAARAASTSMTKTDAELRDPTHRLDDAICALSRGGSFAMTAGAWLVGACRHLEDVVAEEELPAREVEPADRARAPEEARTSSAWARALRLLQIQQISQRCRSAR
jgi:hypothetical protein